MKKLLIILMALTLVAGFATISSAVITGSDHDFSTKTWNPGGEICNVCHVPHNPAYPTLGPLWNHYTPTQTYTLYTSVTLNATVNQPAGVSKLCLGCHDGLTALEAFGDVTTGTNFITGKGNLGNNLSNDHPISFTYDSALVSADGGLATPSGGKVGSANLPLYGTSKDQLECASCHDVHGVTSVNKFLRSTNSGSALCLQCHTK